MPIRRPDGRVADAGKGGCVGMLCTSMVCGHKRCFSVSYIQGLGPEGIGRAYKSSHKRKALL